MKQLIVRPNPQGIGLDLAWRIWSPIDQRWAVSDWWGNTRDSASLRLLIEDLRRHGYTFDLSPSAEQALSLASEQQDVEVCDWCGDRAVGWRWSEVQHQALHYCYAHGLMGSTGP